MADARDFAALVAADSGVQSTLGYDAESPAQVKFYASPAPEGVSLPLATYFVVSGDPTNKISGRPQSDRLLIQIDIFSRSKAESMAIADAIRAAVDTTSQLLNFRDLFEPAIKAHRVSQDFSYWAIQ